MERDFRVQRSLTRSIESVQLNRTNQMRLRSRIVIAVGLAVALVIGFACWVGREPRYQGRSLSMWLDAAARCPVCDPTGITVETFEAAMIGMGDRSIRPLLRHLRQREPSPVHEWCERLLKRFPWVGIELPHQRDLTAAALAAFQVHGTNAVSAIPQLTRRLERNDQPWLAIDALGAIGPASIPVLLGALNSTDPHTPIRAVGALASMGPEAAEALPTLKSFLGAADTPAAVRNEIASALCEFAHPDAATLALLTGLLDDSELNEGAAIGLSRAGREGWLILLDRLEQSASGSTPNLIAAISAGARTDRFRPTPVHATRLDDRFSFARVRSIYNLNNLNFVWAPRTGHENAIRVHSLTNVIGQLNHDEELVVAALRALERIGDEQHIATGCLETLIHDTHSDRVRGHARRMLDRRGRTPADRETGFD
jgi:hypothetical protein